MAQKGRGGLVRPKNANMASPGAARVPVFAGRGASFSVFEQQAHLWMRAAKTQPASRASLLVSHTRSAPRRVRLAEGGDASGHHVGVARIIGILRSFSPQVVKFMLRRRSDQSINENIAELDLLRSKAGPKMETGAGFRGHSVSILRKNHAGWPAREKYR